MTDGLKAVADNTAKLVKEGVSIKKRYIEIIDDVRPGKPKEDPKETAEQIKTRIMASLNKLAKKNETGDNAG